MRHNRVTKLSAPWWLLTDYQPRYFAFAFSSARHAYRCHLIRISHKTLACLIYLLRRQIQLFTQLHQPLRKLWVHLVYDGYIRQPRQKCLGVREPRQCWEEREKEHQRFRIAFKVQRASEMVPWWPYPLHNLDTCNHRLGLFGTSLRRTVRACFIH